jgi:hypothetical protein
LDVLQDVESDCFIVISDHSKDTKQINKPPYKKASQSNPEDESHPPLAQIGVMKTKYP